MNANRYYIFLFTTFLVISFVFSNFAIHTTAQTWVKYCNFPIGTSQWCKNNGTGNDALTKFNNSMRDYVKPTSAYKMNFIQTRWYPSVTRGEPIYQYYTLYDNKNGTYWRYDQHFGKFLNDYSYINTGLSKNVDYYPTSYERPTTNLTIKSANAFGCLSNPLSCNTYTHASQFDIN